MCLYAGKGFFILFFLAHIFKELLVSGDGKKFTSKPDQPTKAFIGGNVSLVWRYYQPAHLTLKKVVFGEWTSSPGFVFPKIMTINTTANSISSSPGRYESRVSWSGNVSASQVAFVLHNIQPADDKVVFGIHLEFGYMHNPLLGYVQIKVEKKPVAVLPRIINITKPHLLKPGANVTLSCVANGLSLLNVTWYKFGKVMSHHHGNCTSKAVLTLYNITREDWGKYVCVAKNSIGEDSKTVFIRTVAVLPRIINITKPPLLTLGANVTLSCVANGLSLLNVTWYKFGRVMSHHHGNCTSKAVLAFYDITREDWGKYVCVAKNAVGEDSKTVFIRILPSSPTILHTNTIARNKSWVLRWSAVYSEGHLVKTYTVWHQLWHIVKDNMTRKESWLRENITGFVYRKELAADTRYLFAVTAWNKWGESELEIDKILNISTKFTDAFTHQIERTTNLLATKKPQWTGISTMPILMSNTKNEEKNNSIPLEALIAFSAFPVVVAFAVWLVCYFRRNSAPWKNPRPQQGRKGFSSPSPLNLTSELALESENRRHSVIMSGSSWFIYGSTPTLTTTTNMDERSSSQPGIAEESLFLKPVIPGPSNAAPTFACYDQPTSQDVKVNNRDHVISAMNNHAIFEVQEDITRDRKDNISQQVGTETSQQMFDSEGYVLPDDSDSVTRARKKMKPRTGPWLKKTLKKENKTFQFQNSTFYIPPERLHVSDGLEMAQHCASPRNPNQLFLTDLQTRTLLGARNYENDPLQDTENALIHGSKHHPMVFGVSPYSHIYCNTSWEIPQDHLSLEEKIGGGEFGQVWRGKLYDVTGTGKWLVVAVKMLQANYSPSDHKDLLSELDLLKKLKPHPNVIRLLGCVTKDVVRCKGKGVFRPPLLILENAPYGDLLGYLRKRRGQNDDYDHFNRMEVPQKIAKQQLYQFATDIARGMEYIASHQLIHRDLAARNVLLGDKLQCKITDFGMARDLGLGDGIYARKSNGVMPLKWMAVESLTNRVSTTESDVWSYGIVLYEIFTLGGKPYDGMTAKEACFFVRSGHRMPRPSAISLELYELMLQCWNKEPSQRPKFSDIVIWMENSLQRV